MKNVLFFLLFAFSANGQTVDSFSIKQVDSLIQMCRALGRQNEFDKALDLIAQTEKICLEKLGRATVSYGTCCHVHAWTLNGMGNLAESEKWYLDAVAIRGQVLGNENTDFAMSCNNLAVVYGNLGQYEKAEHLHIENLIRREKIGGKNHIDYASTLTNLALIYREMGRFDPAEASQRSAIAIFGQLLGKEHPYYVGNLHNLAATLTDIGDFEKAEAVLLEILDIDEKTAQKATSIHAATLNSLAIVYQNLGNYGKAEQLNLESQAIIEHTLGKEHQQFYDLLNNRAVIFQNSGAAEKAEPLYLEARSIIEKTVGKSHTDYAVNSQNLATLYQMLNRPKIAEPLISESIAIREKTIGKTHPDYAKCLETRSEIQFLLGNPEKAIVDALETKTIYENSLGKNHLFYANSLENLADLYTQIGDFENASKAFLEFAEVNKTLTIKALHHLSEREMTACLQLFSNKLNKILSFAQISKRADISQTCYDNALFYKGFLLNSSIKLNHFVFDNPTDAAQFNQLKSLEYRLAAEYANPIADRDSTNVVTIEQKINRLEKSLARTVAGYAETNRQVKWLEIQQNLRPNEVAIEFVNYSFLGKILTDEPVEMYAALLLSPNGIPKFVPLFEEKELEIRFKTTGIRKSDYVNNLYRFSKNQTEKSLFELVWQPLEKELSGVETVYFSPTGLLHRVNLGAIPISENEILADRFNFVELGTTRKILNFGFRSFDQSQAGVSDFEHSKIQNSNFPPDTGQTSEMFNQSAILFGGINYEMDSTAIFDTIFEINSTENAIRSLEIDFSKIDSATRGSGSWNFLINTEKEVDALNQIVSKNGLKPIIKKGFLATEESFKKIGKIEPSQRILHIATHGFFFSDPKSSTKTTENEPVFKTSDYPMIRSGLLLAGGNFAWKTGKPFRNGMEDGILTAYEISQMNLSNTELVVLSACETGLGDIQGNEGVFGLQRAFKIAGAKYLIMSLWQVPDFQTQELMTIFYEKWLTDNFTIPEAFRAAQKKMRGKYEHPFFWAGFVLVE
jgi:CHAT domain-containing protein